MFLIGQGSDDIRYMVKKKTGDEHRQLDISANDVTLD